tara:strand:+ start:188 stop:928 length:741 start_codon:yes stop_codon:yes gene_type:complete
MKKEENTQSYYMNIPAAVWDADIKDKAKLCYGHITVLANKQGYCFANNAYFAKTLGCSITSASRYISELEKLGVITTRLFYKKDSKEVEQRRIYIATATVRIDSTLPSELTVAYHQNLQQPTDQIDRDNTTSINNININNMDVSSHDDIKGKIFYKIVELYPKNRIGNRQQVLKHFKKLSIEECKLSLVNLNRYLKHAGAYIKSLSNYVTEECYTEAWLSAEEKNKSKKNDIKNTKTFTEDYDNIS